MMDSCHKEQFTTKGTLSFSTDTLTFDTVFTTLGSTTKFFKVRNTQSKSINVSDIKLMQLQGNQFRINVDGISGTEFKNIDIPAHDSIYVFVEVTINPNSANNPFVIFDQVQFVTNGITQNVVLEAMGQNAYYHFSEHITGIVTWPNDKPHVIVNKNGGLPFLAIDTNSFLNLRPNTQIYMGPSALITVDGTLRNEPGSTPTWNDSIVFQYIRHDYPNAPGQWLGITYSRIATVNLNHVIIDQSTFGLSDEYVLDVIANAQITTSNLTTYASDQTPAVTLDKCIIRNCSSSALTAIRTNLTATNCLFHSSGGQMVVLGVGGTYNITNCTMANVYNYYTNHQNPSLSITDGITYIDAAKTRVGPYATVANIKNTVVAGSLQNELYISPPPSMVTATFHYCNLTTVVDSFHLIQPADDSCVFNSNTGSLFRAPYNNDYFPDSTTSPLYNKGDITVQRPDDLFDFIRNSKHTVGAIEWPR